jgi:hypothetical protein
MQRSLILLGLALVAVGLFWPWIRGLGLFRLPGDIKIQSQHGTFYFPIVTCIVLSIVISLLLWLFRR